MWRIVGAVLIVASSAAAAAPRPSAPRDRVAVVQSLLDCRSKPDADRLACYDAAADRLSASIDDRKVVVVDRAGITAAKRSLFGFTLPDLGLFGGVKDDAPEDREVVSTVRTAREAGGNWVVTLADGAVWHQTDGQVIARAPRAGDRVTIRRAALGSYFLRIGQQPGVRARRDS